VRFPRRDLLQITAEEVAGYLRYKAYRRSDPSPNDRPNKCRSSSLLQYKKAISYFMPSQDGWNVASNSGNPTKGKVVNKVIKDVKQAEVRKQGKESNVKRPLKRAEFEETLRLLEATAEGSDRFHMACRITAMLKLQWHIIARTDDICNIETEDLRSHGKFPDCALQMKVSWSKNVMSEEQCPDQILLGASNTDYCVIVGLACYLESTLTAGNNKEFLFADSQMTSVTDEDGNQVLEERGPDNLNDKYRRHLTKIWKKDSFEAISVLTRGPLGTHSVRKAPATFASECGKVQDHIEIRGRWKGARGGKTVHRYMSTEQLPTDAAMASCPAVGGPVKYKVKSDAHVTNAFIVEHVVPSIHEFYSSDGSNQIAQVLGPALLWAAFQPELKPLMSSQVYERIRRAYAAVRGAHDDDYNPVERVPLHVYNVENQVCIQELDEATTGVPPQQGGGGFIGPTGSLETMRTLQVQLNRLQQMQAEHHQQANVSG
jgi:hypothetical protein